MESFLSQLIEFICSHAHNAHWIIFLLLMLAGLNFPISEDVMLITGGAIASTCIPEHTLHLFIWIYFGCWISAWEAYWIGRLLGPKLYNIPWFKRFINPKKIENLHYYYEKFGVFTFIVGRFIPGGVRNALYISSGLGKMPFLKFILRDGFACLISSNVLFFLGYKFGENYQHVLGYLKTYSFFILGTIVLALTSLSIYYWRKKIKPNIEN